MVEWNEHPFHSKSSEWIKKVVDLSHGGSEIFTQHKRTVPQKITLLQPWTAFFPLAFFHPPLSSTLWPSEHSNENLHSIIFPLLFASFFFWKKRTIKLITINYFFSFPTHVIPHKSVFLDSSQRPCDGSFARFEPHIRFGRAYSWHESLWSRIRTNVVTTHSVACCVILLPLKS
jgi:hypothetical protein